MKNKYFLKPLYVSAEFYTEKEQNDQRHNHSTVSCNFKGLLY